MTKRKFNSHLFVQDLDRFVLSVRSDFHVRRARVAAFWSIISLVFISGILQVKPDAATRFGGVAIDGLTESKFFIALFFLTLYYGVRFALSVYQLSLQFDWRVLLAEIQMCREQDKNLARNSSAVSSEVRTVLRWMHNKTHPFYKRHDLEREELVTTPFVGETLEDVRSNILVKPFFGFVEYILVPLLIPAALCISAVAGFVVRFLLTFTP